MSRWAEVADAMSAAMLARPEITDVMGAAIYLDEEGGEGREFEVPSLTIMQVVDTESELWEHIDFQIDFYTRTLADIETVEQTVRWLFPDQGRVDLGGVQVFARFQSGRRIVGPGKGRWFGRSLDFRMEPIRSKYVRAAAS